MRTVLLWLGRSAVASFQPFTQAVLIEGSARPDSAWVKEQLCYYKVEMEGHLP